MIDQLTAATIEEDQYEQFIGSASPEEYSQYVDRFITYLLVAFGIGVGHGGRGPAPNIDPRAVEELEWYYKARFSGKMKQAQFQPTPDRQRYLWEHAMMMGQAARGNADEAQLDQITSETMILAREHVEDRGRALADRFSRRYNGARPVDYWCF